MDRGVRAHRSRPGLPRGTDLDRRLEYAEGAIVGSALVRALADGGVDAAGALAAELARGTRPE
jgi:tryptophan synthase alpha chain